MHVFFNLVPTFTSKVLNFDVKDKLAEKLYTKFSLNMHFFPGKERTLHQILILKVYL